MSLSSWTPLCWAHHRCPLDSEEGVVEGDRTEGPAARASPLRVSPLMMNPPGPATESYCDYAGFLGPREREKN